MEPGLVETADSDLFVFRLGGDSSAPELDYLARVGEASQVAGVRSRARLLSLSSMVLSPIRSDLYVSLVKALGRDVAAPLHDRLFALFCTKAEAVLDDVIHAEHLERAHALAFVGCAQDAFEEFLRPYLNSRTLAPAEGRDGVAAAIAFLSRRLAAATRA